MEVKRHYLFLTMLEALVVAVCFAAAAAVYFHQPDGKAIAVGGFAAACYAIFINIRSAWTYRHAWFAATLFGVSMKYLTPLAWPKAFVVIVFLGFWLGYWVWLRTGISPLAHVRLLRNWRR